MSNGPGDGWFSDVLKNELPSPASAPPQHPILEALGLGSDYHPLQGLRRILGGAVAGLGDLPLTVTPYGFAKLPEGARNALERAGRAIGGVPATPGPHSDNPDLDPEADFQAGRAMGPFALPYGRLNKAAEAAAERLGVSAAGPDISGLLGKNANPDVVKLVRPMVRNPQMPRVASVNAPLAQQMARVYEGLPVNDPAARSAYDALNREVEQQYNAIKKAGYNIEFTKADPYKNSAEMMQDVRDNKTLKVFATPEDSFHPYMTPEQNNRFRAVHDFIAHAGPGNQFGPIGEENAYRMHAATLSPEAQQALATETRGQNSWVNFGPNAHLPATERPFAEQKAALWPREYVGDYADMPTENVSFPQPVPLAGRQPEAVMARLRPYQYQGGPESFFSAGPAMNERGAVGSVVPHPPTPLDNSSGTSMVHRFTLPGGDEATVVRAMTGDPSTFRVAWMGSTGGEGSLGPAQVRQIFEHIKASDPQITSIGGMRASGANPGRDWTVPTTGASGASILAGMAGAGAAGAAAGSQLGDTPQDRLRNSLLLGSLGLVGGGPALSRLLEGAGAAGGAALPALDETGALGAQGWTPDPRGALDREGAPVLQGTATPDPRLFAQMPRGQASELAQAIGNSKVVERGLRADAERGLSMGGLPWYELGPLKAAYDETDGPFTFNDWNNASGSGSIQNPTHNEMASASALLFGQREGLDVAGIKRAFRRMYPGEPKLWLNNNTMSNFQRAQDEGLQLPPSPGADERKVPWYSQGKLGGSLEGFPALDTHERRRLLQLAATDRKIKPLLNDMGLLDAGGRKDELVPIKNALDYEALGAPYQRLARSMGLPSTQAFQAGRWIGGADKTGLLSQPFGDYIQTFEDALLHTARRRGLDTSPAGLRALRDRVLQGRDILTPVYGKNPFGYLYGAQGDLGL